MPLAQKHLENRGIGTSKRANDTVSSLILLELLL